MKKTYLEAVTVCIGFSDYLINIIASFPFHFDRFVVVTHESDERTIKVCRIFGFEFVLTTRVYDSGPGTFNKGKAINDGLAVLDRSEWCMHVDADMWLNQRFRRQLDKLITSGKVTPDKLWGCPRYVCPTYKEYLLYLFNQEEMEEDMARGTFRPGWRHQHHRRRGNNGSKGYLQLWHWSNPALAEKPWYPEDYDYCGKSDKMFYKKFEPNVGCLEGICPVELNADYKDTPDERFKAHGPDWHGRTSKPFGAEE